MSHHATNRLIDAAANLGPADRALLNIWANRGLDDTAVARMTGMSAETIANRRARIVEHLSTELGLPPEDVRRALAEIAPTAEVSPAAATDAPAANGTAPSSALESAQPRRKEVAPPKRVTPTADRPTADSPETNATARAAVRPDAGSASRRRRVLCFASVLVVIVVAVVLVALLGSSGSAHHRAVTTAADHPAPTSSTTPAPSPPVTRPPGEPLVALPGGLEHTTGTVRVTGSRSRLRLDLSVSNAPAVPDGHYEVWLYDSLVNSEAVGRLGAGESHLSLPLPDDARRYRWIDISIQPAGRIFHSGDSVLRSANPLFAEARPGHP